MNKSVVYAFLLAQFFFSACSSEPQPAQREAKREAIRQLARQQGFSEAEVRVAEIPDSELDTLDLAHVASVFSAYRRSADAIAQGSQAAKERDAELRARLAAARSSLDSLRVSNWFVLETLRQLPAGAARNAAEAQLPRLGPEEMPPKQKEKIII